MKCGFAIFHDGLEMHVRGVTWNPDSSLEAVVMVTIRKPSGGKIAEFLASQAGLEFTYSAIGATNANMPPGYVVDRTRVRLGHGENVFHAAKAVLQRWQHFHLTWVEACPATTPIMSGEVVGILARSVGLWWLNACRIVYVVDEAENFGFANGTLPGHMETGEERFLVEWDRNDDSVWYDILAFSRPRHLLARLGYPWMRRVQKRFARESAAAMTKAVSALLGSQ
jgi:uncharacterized protein (UPF0548 family)